MSLVIGRVDNGKVYILGDTALSFEDSRKANPFTEGCLKQYIISDILAIAFAGESSHFEDSCPKFLLAVNATEIINIAIEAQKNGKNFELLIGEAGYKDIRIIKNGILNESTAGYIGDKDAFEAFQKYFHMDESTTAQTSEVNRASLQFMRIPEPIREGEIYGSLYRAFKNVIINTQIQSVGGMIVPLCTDKGRFCYINYADVTSDLLNINDFTETPKTIEFGTAAGGGYSVELCDDMPYGGQGKNIGYYFLQGGFGVVFPPTQTGLRKPQIVRAENPAYWVLETSKLLGHGIGSHYMTADHCGIAGEKLLSEVRFRDAFFCYELGKDCKTLIDRPEVRDRYVRGYVTAMFNSGNHIKKIIAIDILRQFINLYPQSRSKSLLNQMLDVYRLVGIC